MTKKKVFINGYADDNLGDDIFFDLLFTKYPQADFYFNVKGVPNNLKQYSNCKVIYKQKIEFFKFLSQMDIYLLIGGSMFQESNSFKLMISKWIKNLILFLYLRMKSVKIACIGFNFGPVRTKAFLNLYRILFEIPNYLSVRDEDTYKLFKKNSKFHYYPDIVFGISNSLMSKKKLQSLGVSIMDFGPNVSFQKEYNEFIAQVLNNVDSSIPINIYGFQNSKTISDITVINDVLRKVDRLVNVMLYDGNNLKEFIGSYGANTYAITTRFHSLVLSLLNQQATLSIKYNIKVTNLLKMVNTSTSQVSISDLSNGDIAVSCATKINNFFKDEELARQSLVDWSKIESYKKYSTKHFEYLDELLIE